MPRVHAWCEGCGHHETWHFQGGPCTHRYDEVHVLADQDCTCGLFQLGEVWIPEEES